MRDLLKISKYQLNDVIRSKWSIIYSSFFLIVTYGLINFTYEPSKVLITLMNIIIILIPLISIVFCTIYLYNNKDSITFLSSQPVSREVLYIGMFLGSVLPLAAGFVLGVSVPIIIFANIFFDYLATVLVLIIIGVTLTFIFGSMAFLIATKNDDRLKGLGLSLFVWLVLSIMYDGIVMLVMQSFQEYPLEKISIGITLLNPIDLGRILLILKFDISALMGYTGAVFHNFFNGSEGTLIAAGSLVLWFVIPGYFGITSFRKKDF